MKQGLIHLYYGNGKGKTTAAVGLAVRCAGAGGKVLFFQLLKDNGSSERRILEATENIDVIDGIGDIKFVWTMTDNEKLELKTYYEDKLAEIFSGLDIYDMAVLDEAAAAIECGLVSENMFMKLLRNKPQCCEIVLTGHNPSERLKAAADYVTEMKGIKHPYEAGVKARKGIEF